LKPYQSNEITWTEEYGMYAAAQTELQNGTTINKMTELPPPVSNANAYLFQNGSFQIDPDTPAGSMAESNGDVVCNRDIAKEWEFFLVESPFGSTIVALKSWHNKYLSA
jgi:hypothetical protein